MTAVFLDTGALYDAADARSSCHDPCRAEYERLLRSGGALITTELILAELHVLVLRRVGPAPARRVVSLLGASPRVTVLPVDRPIREAAVELLAARPGCRYSLADAVSFTVMRELGATAAFTLDADFAAEGFALLPAPRGPGG